VILEKLNVLLVDTPKVLMRIKANLLAGMPAGQARAHGLILVGNHLNEFERYRD